MIDFLKTMMIKCGERNRDRVPEASCFDTAAFFLLAYIHTAAEHQYN